MSGTKFKRPDQRGQQAQEYRKNYHTRRWRQIRAGQLQREPLCAICLKAGRVTAATVCDHIDPKTKETNFFAGPFQSLCDEAPWRCHSSTKQQQERIGYDKTIGLDGWPTDPMHPANTQGRG